MNVGCGKKEEIKTFCSSVGSPDGFRDALEPAGLYTVKTALTLYQLLTGHVDGAIVVIEDYASAPADNDCTYKENKEEEEKSGEDDEEGEEDEEGI